MSGSNNDTKSLHIVFQRAKNDFKEDEIDYQRKYLSKFKFDRKAAQDARLLARKALQMKLDAMRGDFNRKRGKALPYRTVIMSDLIEAIKDSNAQEDKATAKFVDTVESMMTRFNTDLVKLQKIYTNVMEKLPKSSI